MDHINLAGGSEIGGILELSYAYKISRVLVIADTAEDDRTSDCVGRKYHDSIK